MEAEEVIAVQEEAIMTEFSATTAKRKAMQVQSADINQETKDLPQSLAATVKSRGIQLMSAGKD